MKLTCIAALFLLGILAAAGSARPQETPGDFGGDAAADTDGIPANDPDETGVADFQEELGDQGGQWKDLENVGQVWVPPVPADSSWRPYTNGHWANTDQGWAWMSAESWGWATYHYGRWLYDSSVGWAWVPGSVWAPAWVAWREGGGNLGWAPLPPSVGFTLQAGLDSDQMMIPASFYTFVPERDILAPRISAVIVSTRRNATIISATTNVTRYRVVRNRVINQSVDPQRIAQITGKAVPTLHVAALAAKSQAGRPGPFYQPPAVRRAALATRGEFGAALPAHVAAQRRAAGQPSSGGRTAHGGIGRHVQGGTASGSAGTDASTRRPSAGHHGSGSSSSGQPDHSARGGNNPPPPRSQPPPARPSAPPPRPSAPPPKPSSPPPASSGGHKPPG